LSSLAGAGGKDANEWLVQYLADRRSRYVSVAITKIAGTDRALAVREAKQALESGRKLTDRDRKTLEALAK